MGGPSACDTGLGTVTAGEGVLGTSSVSIAGAHTVIAEPQVRWRTAPHGNGWKRSTRLGSATISTQQTPCARRASR